ncbi:MAG TPA: FAD-dependent oxidoreductase, partial [Arenibaculum sp.]|nr:FAD-dependent oxidoreductase [Arenibaculum sp.]
MKVIVLGAGVIGVTTAHYLRELGHEVTVVDRNSGPAMETSFGNAGGVCPGFAGPWAAPGMPLKVAKWMFQPSAPLLFRPRMDPRQWTWLAQFLANCSQERFALNKERMQRIAQYSKTCLVRLREDTRIAYDNETSGVLQLFRTQSELDGGARSAAVLERFGIAHRIVDRREALAIEPALARSRADFAGGLHLPDDETGDCHIFTRRLSALLERRDVRFSFDTAVLGLNGSGERIDGVRTNRGVMTADAYVVALGPHAPG